MIIDGQKSSVFTAYLLNNSYLSIVSYPTMKQVLSNDWAEYDGLDVDLTNPKFDNRNIELSILLTDKNRYDDFVAFLTETTHRNWTFTELNKTFRLRVSSFSSYHEFESRNEIKVKLIDDFPLNNFTYHSPTGVLGSTEWMLDNKKFSEYGIYTLLGSEEIHRVEEVKKPLEITNRTLDASVVASQSLKLKSRKATIKCYIRSHIDDFWRNYYAFLYDLSKQGERTITADSKTYKCYYESGKVNDFIIKNDFVLCAFDVSLILI